MRGGEKKKIDTQKGKEKTKGGKSVREREREGSTKKSERYCHW